MSCIIDNGVIMYMSTVIGICGTNFCSLCADSRKVTNDKNTVKVVNNTTQKVFKINDRVLFGATGVFKSTENLLDPLKVYPDKSVITVRTAYKAVIDYINRNKSIIDWCYFRNYMVGGKDNKGRFCIYEIHFNPDTGEVDTTLRMPSPPMFNFSISCALPLNLQGEEQEYINKVGNAISSSNTHGEMLNGIKDVIKEISKKDITVGGEMQVVSIF